MENKINVDLRSEIGELQGVILHTPGQEVENMTPSNVERALYSDILNLSIAQREYMQLSQVLDSLTHTWQISDLLTDILRVDKVKRTLVSRVCTSENAADAVDMLLGTEPEELSRLLIEGIPMKKNTLTKYLSRDRYMLEPLHNFFFMRDASTAIHNSVLINRMANKVRERESVIMEAVFDYHPAFTTNTVNPMRSKYFVPEVTMEGGDILIAREDTLIIGMGVRTTSQGIDYILRKFGKNQGIKNLIIQELPANPESFIHVDMAFTFLDVDKVMIYEPLILKKNRFITLHIEIDNGEVVSITEEDNLLTALRKLKFDIQALYCGGRADADIQEREQWHSGANFFAIGPGRVIGYGRNQYTIEELNKNGFEVILAEDVISGRVNPMQYPSFVITIEGSELSRGGGGCRCMTMPVSRNTVKW